MTEPGRPTPPEEELISTPAGGHADRVATVARYLETNRDRYTEDALATAARDRGYPDDVVEEAIRLARAKAASEPVRHRARRWILAAYLVTFAVLTAGMFANEAAGIHGAGGIGTVILGLTLGLALAVSVAWVRKVSAAAGLVGLLALPIVLLVVVAGMCVATGLPTPRLS